MSINTSEQLQSFIRQFINRLIREDFSDLDDIPLDALDINVPRQAVKLICLHDDSDSLLHTIVRLLIYGFFVFNKSISEGYFVPYLWFQENNDFIPQIQLYFMDDPKLRTKSNKNKPLELLCSFRLPNIDIRDITSRREIEMITDRILLEFKNKKITKGKYKYSYFDKINKQKLHCFVQNKSEAIDLFQGVLNVLQLTFDIDNLVEHTPEKNFSVSEKRKIFGQTYEIERRRSGVVEFKRATLHIQGIKPILLCNNRKILINGDWANDLLKSFYA